MAEGGAAERDGRLRVRAREGEGERQADISFFVLCNNFYTVCHFMELNAVFIRLSLVLGTFHQKF